MQGAGCGKAARPVLRGVSPVRDLPTYQIKPKPSRVVVVNIAPVIIVGHIAVQGVAMLIIVVT